METIGQQKIWSFLDRSDDCRITTNTKIREGAGHKVSSYLELARKIAELQFRNRDHVLMFRGQGGDHRNQKNNTSTRFARRRCSMSRIRSGSRRRSLR
jgi:hypothetical protein